MCHSCWCRRSTDWSDSDCNTYASMVPIPNTVVGVVVFVDDRGFVRGDALAAAALSMLSARPCPSNLSVFIRLPPAFTFELAILCTLLGLRLDVLGRTRAADVQVRYWVHARIRIFSGSVSHGAKSESESKSNTIAPLTLFMLRRGVLSH
jgi:hypothetical protein